MPPLEEARHSLKHHHEGHQHAPAGPNPSTKAPLSQHHHREAPTTSPQTRLPSAGSSQPRPATTMVTIGHGPATAPCAHSHRMSLPPSNCTDCHQFPALVAATVVELRRPSPLPSVGRRPHTHPCASSRGHWIKSGCRQPAQAAAWQEETR
jgi:hypothetical protein